MSHWSKKDVAILEAMAGIHHLPKIAETLGRTPEAVQSKAMKLGISVAVRARTSNGAPVSSAPPFSERWINESVAIALREAGVTACKTT